VILISCLVALLIARRESIRRCLCVLIAICTLTLIGVDQHRLQPWAWQFVILSTAFATAQAPVAMALWRLQVIGIYAWSAWSKMDHSFCLEHGPFLLDGICRSLGFANGTRTWPANIRYLVAALIPTTEFLIAVGLTWKRTRLVAVVAATLMHIGLLLSLGPFGHGHQPGVLVWNLFFVVQNWFVFAEYTRKEAHVLTTESNPISLIGPISRISPIHLNRHRVADGFAIIVMLSAMIWPALEPIGLCDHWPAWAVYAAKPERVIVLVDETDAAKLPPNLQAYLAKPDLEGWSALRIDRWSLDALYVPIYPQDRFQVGVALALARTEKLKQIRVVMLGPANRWTGKRTSHQYDGVPAIEELAGRYRCNAFPRQ
jgi:hypothetical protein